MKWRRGREAEQEDECGRHRGAAPDAAARRLVGGQQVVEDESPRPGTTAGGGCRVIFQSVSRRRRACLRATPARLPGGKAPNHRRHRDYQHRPPNAANGSAPHDPATAPRHRERYEGRLGRGQRGEARRRPARGRRCRRSSASLARRGGSVGEERRGRGKAIAFEQSDLVNSAPHVRGGTPRRRPGEPVPAGRHSHHAARMGPRPSRHGEQDPNRVAEGRHARGAGGSSRAVTRPEDHRSQDQPRREMRTCDVGEADAPPDHTRDHAGNRKERGQIAGHANQRHEPGPVHLRERTELHLREGAARQREQQR